ncbi:MAG: hypothetical protein IKG27_00105 [Bacilli bacterium]|nr:hypothetical protein [Bacilli bacterium]
MYEDKRANRYSLKIADMELNETVIPINYNGETKEKMPLTVIDDMTTKFETKEDFKKFLMDLGYDYGYVFIEYRAKGERHIIDAAYGPGLIAKESSFREKELNRGKEEPKRSENIILLGYELIDIERHNKPLWSHLQKYMWKDLKAAISTYNHMLDIEAEPRYILEYQYDIMNYLGDYTVFRKIVLGIDEFYKKEYNEDIVEKNIKQKVMKKGR